MKNEKRFLPQKHVSKSIIHLTLILLLLFSMNTNLVRLGKVQADSEIAFGEKNQKVDQMSPGDNIKGNVYTIYLPLITKGSPPPGAFNKNAPANGTMGTTLAPVLSWNVSTNVTKYEYCYDTTNDGTCSTWISTGTNNYVGLWALQPATTYYWQVR